MLKQPLVISTIPDPKDPDWVWITFKSGYVVFEELSLENDPERINSAISAVISDLCAGKYVGAL